MIGREKNDIPSLNILHIKPICIGDKEAIVHCSIVIDSINNNNTIIIIIIIF